MSLNTRTEPMDNRRISLFVEVDQNRVDQELRKAARKVGAEYRIPGFRKGKAPYSIVVKYVGLPTLYSEFLDTLGNEIYMQAVEQEEIEPYAMASLDIDTLEPLTYNFEIPLEPTIDLGDYRSLRLDEEEAEVTEEEIDEVLSDLRASRAGWTDVERPSEYGDMLTIDVKSVLIKDETADATADDTNAEDDEETVVLDEEDWDVMLDEENPMEPAGLDQELLGMSPGEEKDFELSWPEDSQSMYAGKKARFHVKLHKTQANLEPELDDKFAASVDEKFETLEDLRNDIRDSLLESKKRQAENDYLEAVLDKLVEQSEMDYPPVVVEDQIDSMVSEFARQLRMYGIDSLETFLQQTGQSMEEYRDSMREQAEIAARRNLVISELYQKEGFTVSDAEVEERIEEMRAGFGGEDATDEQEQMAELMADSMRQGPARPVLESQILQEKSLRRLLAIARGEEVPEPGAPDPESEESASDEESTEPVAEMANAAEDVPAAAGDAGSEAQTDAEADVEENDAKP